MNIFPVLHPNILDLSALTYVSPAIVTMTGTNDFALNVFGATNQIPYMNGTTAFQYSANLTFDGTILKNTGHLEIYQADSSLGFKVFGFADNTKYIQAYLNASSVAAFESNAGSMVFNAATGNATVDFKSHGSGDINFNYATSGTGSFIFYSGGSDYTNRGVWDVSRLGVMRVLSNVRIGSKVAPTVALDVTGAALISTTLGVTGNTTLASAVRVGSAVAPTASRLHIATGYDIEKDTDDLTIYTAANKTLVLEEPVWKDINLGAANFVLPSSGYPDRVAFVDKAGGTTVIETLAFAVNEGVSSQFEMQHDYEEGTDVTFHIHWQGITAPAGGTDNVQWRLTYTITRDGQTMNVPTVIDSPDAAITAQYQCVRSSFAAIAGATGGYDGGFIRIGDQFIFKLERTAATADEYGGDALLVTAGLHYQIDTIGSRTISAK